MPVEQDDYAQYSYNSLITLVGIVSDPNDWSREHEQPRYIIDLIGRIVALSLKTNRIVNSLPELGLP